MTFEQARAIRNGLSTRRVLCDEALTEERMSGRLTGHEDLVARIKRIDRAIARAGRQMVSECSR